MPWHMCFFLKKSGTRRPEYERPSNVCTYNSPYAQPTSKIIWEFREMIASGLDM